ncbi:MAG TPA: hypothetical protein VHA75_12140 [Rugosimonospora sp.]|nr:hypothetical protein [Rugosimonospora sp.]
MTTDEATQERWRTELRTVQDEAAEARAALDRIRRGLGDSGAGTIDAAEGAADLTAVEEQQALVDALETRERALRDKLGLPAA